MRDEHIISLIENTPLASLGEADLARVRAHTGACSECLRAFQAAQVARLLLQERAAVEFEPSPFFHTRVLAKLRERQAANEANEFWAFGRMWRAAGALASSMAAAVALLAVFTFVVPENPGASPQVSSLGNGYSAEEVILDQTPQEVSEGQMLTTIYGGEEESSR